MTIKIAISVPLLLNICLGVTNAQSFDWTRRTIDVHIDGFSTTNWDSIGGSVTAIAGYSCPNICSVPFQTFVVTDDASSNPTNLYYAESFWGSTATNYCQDRVFASSQFGFVSNGFDVFLDITVDQGFPGEPYVFASAIANIAITDSNNFANTTITTDLTHDFITWDCGFTLPSNPIFNTDSSNEPIYIIYKLIDGDRSALAVINNNGFGITRSSEHPDFTFNTPQIAILRSPKSPLLDNSENNNFPDIMLMNGSSNMSLTAELVSGWGVGASANTGDVAGPVNAQGFTPRDGIVNHHDLIAVENACLSDNYFHYNISIDYDGDYDNDIDDYWHFWTNFYYGSPDSCLADVNVNGQKESTDFNAWINAYNNGLPKADVNGDGQVTPTDYTAWQNVYNTGANNGC